MNPQESQQTPNVRVDVLLLTNMAGITFFNFLKRRLLMFVVPQILRSFCSSKKIKKSICGQRELSKADPIMHFILVFCELEAIPAPAGV